MLGVAQAAPQVADLLVDLDRSDVALALVVRERDGEVNTEAQDVVAVSVEATHEVVALAFETVAASMLGRWVRPVAEGDELSVS